MTKKELLFKKYTNEHIRLVNANVHKIVKAYPEFAPLVEIAKRHDKNKFNGVNYKPYVEIVWLRTIPGAYEKLPHAEQEILNKTIRNHCETNSHHPEFWSKSNMIMPDIAIAEMVADWAAVGKVKNNSIKFWFNKTNGTRFKWTKHQIELIKKLIKVFE